MTLFKKFSLLLVNVVFHNVLIYPLQGILRTIHVIDIAEMLIIHKMIHHRLQQLEIQRNGLLIHAYHQNLLYLHPRNIIDQIRNLISILIDITRIEYRFVSWIELDHSLFECKGITLQDLLHQGLSHFRDILDLSHYQLLFSLNYTITNCF